LCSLQVVIVTFLFVNADFSHIYTTIPDSFQVILSLLVSLMLSISYLTNRVATLQALQNCLTFPWLWHTYLLMLCTHLLLSV